MGCGIYGPYILMKYFICIHAEVAFLYYAVVDEDMLMALAHQKYRAGNYKQALDHSTTVYERNPRRTDNLLLMGAMHYQVTSFYSGC